MAATLRNIIDAVTKRVQIAGGPGVQLYSEDSIVQMINDQHRMLFDKYWFPWAMTIGDQYTLDGTTGKITDDLSAKVFAYEDIQNVWYGNEPNPLPRYQSLINPMYTPRKGIVPDSDPTKVFRVIPTTAIGTVTLNYRTAPAEFANDTDVVQMDKLLLTFACAYDFCNGLGWNPAEEQKLLNLLNDRLKTVIGNMEGKLAPMGGGNPYTSDGWQEVS